MGMYLACILLESLGVISFRSVLVSSLMPDRNVVPLAIVAWYFRSVVFISGTVWYLASRLAGALRRRDAEMAAVNRRLVAATEERARYMLHTTHQLKAPFAAIHANTQLLLGGYCGPVPDARRRRDRADRGPLRDAVAGDQGHAATGQPPVPRPESARSRSRSTLPALIRSCLANLQPQAAKRGIVFDEDLPDASVWGIPDHAVDDARQRPLQRDQLLAGRAARLGVLPADNRAAGRRSSSATGGLASRPRSCRGSSTTTSAPTKPSRTTGRRPAWDWPSCAKRLWPTRSASG